MRQLVKSMLKSRIVSIIAFMAYHFRLCRLCFKAVSFFRGKKILAVFVFHRVTDAALTSKYLKDYERGEAREVFEEQIRAIRRYFKILDLDEFLEVLNGEKDLTAHAALLTFDDADADFIEHALPILQKYDCPSVNFAPTDYIDTEKRFWHLRLSNLIYNSSPDSLKKMLENSEGLPENLIGLIKSIPGADARQMVVLSRQIAVAFDEMDQDTFDSILDQWENVTSIKYLLDIKCMGWDELRYLENNSVKIESHTASHRKLGKLKIEGIRDELVGSKNKLEAELNKKVKMLCYPVGSFNDLVLKEMAEAGYEAGFTSMPGVCAYPSEGDGRYKIPRLGIYGDSRSKINLFLGRIALKRLLGRL